MRNKLVRIANGRSARLIAENIRRQIKRKQVKIDILNSSISLCKAQLREHHVSDLELWQEDTEKVIQDNKTKGKE